MRGFKSVIAGAVVLSVSASVGRWLQADEPQQKTLWLKPQILFMRTANPNLKKELVYQADVNPEFGGYFQVTNLPPVKIKNGEKIEIPWKYQDALQNTTGELKCTPKFRDDGTVQLEGCITTIYVSRPDLDEAMKAKVMNTTRGRGIAAQHLRPVKLGQPIVVAHNWTMATPDELFPRDEVFLQVTVVEGNNSPD